MKRLAQQVRKGERPAFRIDFSKVGDGWRGQFEQKETILDPGVQIAGSPFSVGGELCKKVV